MLVRTTRLILHTRRLKGLKVPQTSEQYHQDWDRHSGVTRCSLPQGHHMDMCVPSPINHWITGTRWCSKNNLQWYRWLLSHSWERGSWKTSVTPSSPLPPPKVKAQTGRHWREVFKIFIRLLKCNSPQLMASGGVVGGAHLATSGFYPGVEGPNSGSQACAGKCSYPSIHPPDPIIFVSVYARRITYWKVLMDSLPPVPSRLPILQGMTLYQKHTLIALSILSGFQKEDVKSRGRSDGRKLERRELGMHLIKNIAFI